jgi:DNA polymerase elongation subunit (family B)
MTYLFDIETESRPREDIQVFAPEITPTKTAIKAGEEAVAKYISDKQDAFFEKAALSPIHGQIFSIAYREFHTDGTKDDSIRTRMDMAESELIQSVFNRVAYCIQTNGKLIGWCSGNFDIPFILRRALILDVPIPAAMQLNGRGKYYGPPCHVDMQDVWAAGEYQAKGSLDHIGLAMGFDLKPMGGEFFAPSWRNGETRDMADAYWRLEMDILEAIAKRSGILS